MTAQNEEKMNGFCACKNTSHECTLSVDCKVVKRIEESANIASALSFCRGDLLVANQKLSESQKREAELQERVKELEEQIKRYGWA